MRLMEEHNAQPLWLHEVHEFIDETAAISEAHGMGAAFVPMRLLVPGWRCSDAAPLDFELATREQEAAILALVRQAGGCTARSSLQFTGATTPSADGMLCSAPTLPSATS